MVKNIVGRGTSLTSYRFCRSEKSQRGAICQAQDELHIRHQNKIEELKRLDRGEGAPGKVQTQEKQQDLQSRIYGDDKPPSYDESQRSWA